MCQELREMLLIRSPLNNPLSKVFFQLYPQKAQLGSGKAGNMGQAGSRPCTQLP